MAKKKSASTNSILLDSKSADAKGVEFAKEHAENIFKEQHRIGKGDWTISEGQKLIVKDGNIVSAGDTGTSTE